MDSKLDKYTDLIIAILLTIVALWFIGGSIWLLVDLVKWIT